MALGAPGCTCQPEPGALLIPALFLSGSDSHSGLDGGGHYGPPPAPILRIFGLCRFALSQAPALPVHQQPPSMVAITHTSPARFFLTATRASPNNITIAR